MSHPIGVRLLNREGSFERVAIDAAVAASQLEGHDRPNGPAVVVARSATIIEQQALGVIDPSAVIAVLPGDWSNAVLIVLPEEVRRAERVQEPNRESAKGDAAFLELVATKAPHLSALARTTLSSIRDQGVDGALVEEGGGRWVNRPKNSFTLKVQPRVGNLHFTVYGWPKDFAEGDFLLPDQNSYSRGWVRNSADATRLAEIVRLSHSRKR